MFAVMPAFWLENSELTTCVCFQRKSHLEWNAIKVLNMFLLQMKRYNWEQEQIKNMKEYIARFGHGSAKLARQAQSKEKTLAKMVQAGLTEKVFILP